MAISLPYDAKLRKVLSTGYGSLDGKFGLVLDKVPEYEVGAPWTIPNPIADANSGKFNKSTHNKTRCWLWTKLPWDRDPASLLWDTIEVFRFPCMTCVRYGGLEIQYIIFFCCTSIHQVEFPATSKAEIEK